MFVLQTIHNLNSKVPEKQCIHAAKSCNCYVFMYQDAFRFFVLLKNMLFCYSLLAATNHKTYQQIERSNNFFQKNSCVMGVARKSRTFLSQGSPCGAKKPPGRMRGISFVSQTGWWRRGESNSRRRRFHALSQKPRNPFRRCQSPFAGCSSAVTCSFSSSFTF